MLTFSSRFLSILWEQIHAFFRIFFKYVANQSVVSFFRSTLIPFEMERSPNYTYFQFKRRPTRRSNHTNAQIKLPDARERNCGLRWSLFYFGSTILQSYWNIAKFNLRLSNKSETPLRTKMQMSGKIHWENWYLICAHSMREYFLGNILAVICIYETQFMNGTYVNDGMGETQFTVSCTNWRSHNSNNVLNVKIAEKNQAECNVD